MIGVTLAQFGQVRGYRFLLPIGRRGDREAPEEAPQVDFCLALQVGEGLPGRHRVVEIGHQGVEAVVVEGLSAGVVLAERREPHLRGRGGEFDRGMLVRVSPHPTRP